MDNNYLQFEQTEQLECLMQPNWLRIFAGLSWTSNKPNHLWQCKISEKWCYVNQKSWQEANYVDLIEKVYMPAVRIYYKYISDM